MNYLTLLVNTTNKQRVFQTFGGAFALDLFLWATGLAALILGVVLVLRPGKVMMESKAARIFAGIAVAFIVLNVVKRVLISQGYIGE